MSVTAEGGLCVEANKLEVNFKPASVFWSPDCQRRLCVMGSQLDQRAGDSSSGPVSLCRWGPWQVRTDCAPSHGLQNPLCKAPECLLKSAHLAGTGSRGKGALKVEGGAGAWTWLAICVCVWDHHGSRLGQGQWSNSHRMVSWEELYPGKRYASFQVPANKLIWVCLETGSLWR